MEARAGLADWQWRLAAYLVFRAAQYGNRLLSVFFFIGHFASTDSGCLRVSGTVVCGNFFRTFIGRNDDSYTVVGSRYDFRRRNAERDDGCEP